MEDQQCCCGVKLLNNRPNLVTDWFILFSSSNWILIRYITAASFYQSYSTSRSYAVQLHSDPFFFNRASLLIRVAYFHSLMTCSISWYCLYMWLWSQIRWCFRSWWNDGTNWIQNGNDIFILNNGIHSKASPGIGSVVMIEFDDATEIVQLFAELTVSLMISSLLALRPFQHVLRFAPVAYGRLFILLLLVLTSRLGISEPLLLPWNRRADRLADRRVGWRRDRWRRHRVRRRIGRNEWRNGRRVRHRVERWNGQNELRKRRNTRFEIDPRRPLSKRWVDGSATEKITNSV